MRDTRRMRVAVVSATLVMAACGGDSGTGASEPTSGEATATTVETTTTTATAGETTTTAAAGSPAGGGGHATLTVGDQTYEFDNYYCLIGSENTGNENISFSSGAFGEVEGNRAQLDASIYDGEAQDRMEGDVTRPITLNDVADFSNPKVGWAAESGLHSDPVTFNYTGSALRVETVFDNSLTAELEEIPGVLEATCGR